MRRWGIEDGLPLDRLTGIAKTPDGFLWLGTDGQGLARFDGRRFDRFDPTTQPGLPFWDISALFCDSRGRLWVRSLTQLAMRDTGVQFRVLDGRLGGGLAENALGEILVRGPTNYTLSRIGRDSVERIYESPQGEFIPRWWTSQQILCDASGRVWGVNRTEGTVYEITDQGPRFVASMGSENEPLSEPGPLLPMPDGRPAILFQQGLAVLNEGRWESARRFPSELGHQIQPTKGICDSGGALWIGTADQHLVLWRPDDLPRVVSDPALDSISTITAFLQDVSGSIWITSHAGLFQLRPAALRTWVPPESDGPRIRGLEATRDGSIWFSTLGQLYRWPLGAMQPVPTGITELFRGLTPGLDGSLLGSDGLKSVLRVPAPPPGATWQVKDVWRMPNTVVDILDSRKHGLLVAAGPGLYRKVEGGFEPVALPGDGKSKPGMINAILEDPEGELWIMRSSGELYRLGLDGWQDLSPPFLPVENEAPGFTLTPDGTVWVAVRSRELRCFRKGVWNRFGPQHLDLPRGAMGIAADQQGGLWWATHAEGVFHLGASSARALAVGETHRATTIRFGLADGLLSLAGDGYYGTPVRDTEGRIWWPTAHGASFLDPAKWDEIAQNAEPPHVYLKEVSLDGETMPWGAGEARVRVPPGTDRVEIRCTVVAVDAPERAHLEYRLAGYDTDWVGAGDNRSALYQKLDPGDYRFEARVAGQSLRWSEPLVLVSLVALPAWWQTPTFRIVAGTGTLGLLWFTRWRKIRQWDREKKRRDAFSQQLIRSQETERARIASELHDSLGQSLLVAKNQIYLVHEAATDDRIKARLEQAATNIGSALDEARAISHRLRPLQLAHLGLTKTVESLVKQVTDSTGIPIRSVVKPVDGLLPADSEVLVYRILQEALSNVVRHADASQVWVRLEPSRQRLQVLIKDDGRGFETGPVTDGAGAPRGLGLTGFEERARLLGGQFTCRSAPGSGTTLVFDIPIPTSAPDADETSDQSRHR